MHDDTQAQALAIRLWRHCLATQETLCTYLGIRLGLYEALADGAPVTAATLAARAGIAVRYAREWLEQQAVAGVVRVESAAGAERSYSLPAAHKAVLTASDSPLSRVAAILPLGAVAQALPRLLDAYRTGSGVPDEAFGTDWREGHGSANRAVFAHQLPSWIRSACPDVHERLSAPDARVADVGCGAGWASIALALRYPRAHVEGFDVDAAIVGDATGHAVDAGVADRVRFHVQDCSRDGLHGPFDLVCLLDTLHELPRPVEILRNCRESTAPGGAVLVMDAKVAHEFSAPGDEIERFQYTTSVLHCLPACLAEQPSAGTGTVMRAHTVERYAHEAGFSAVRILPVDDRFHRLYRCVQ